MPVAGSIPRDAALSLPERHLGLVQAQEHGDLHARIAQLADLAERCIDLDRIVQLAKPVRTDAHAVIPLPPPGQRIALAQDAAFSFIYPHLIEGWRRAGAEIVTFSPLADQPPPADCDACWLPGGYPELHAGTLAQAEHFRAGLARFAAQRPVHGECGGYMVLGEILEDAASARHRMAGLLSHSTSFARRRLSLGYRAATLLDNGILGRKGVMLRGHEFHYATLIDKEADEPLASMTDAAGRALGQAGARRGLVSGSFFHILATEMEPA
jgi:cobyrinic acid a,c-diamide synthase